MYLNPKTVWQFKIIIFYLYFIIVKYSTLCMFIFNIWWIYHTLYHPLIWLQSKFLEKSLLKKFNSIKDILNYLWWKKCDCFIKSCQRLPLSNTNASNWLKNTYMLLKYIKFVYFCYIIAFICFSHLLVNIFFIKKT